MNGSEFSKSLLKSSKIDAPLSGSKTRALVHVEQALKASTSIANAAASTTNAITSAKLAVAIAATAVAAGAVGVGGGYALAHMTPRAQPVAIESHSSISAQPAFVNGVVGPTANGSLTAASSTSNAAPATSNEPAAASDSCKAIDLEASDKCSTSTARSRTVTFAVTNDCSSTDLDFFWVDRSCKEAYRGVVSPSQILWQDTREGDLFRLRDRVTHKLVKEFSVTAVEGAPDRTQVSKAPAVDLPEITITDANAPITDGRPAECFHAGARAAKLHVRNDRKNEAIALSWIWADCTEHDTRMIYPGKTFDTTTTEGHAWRIRDTSGALLLEVPPAGLDTTTYVTAP